MTANKNEKMGVFLCHSSKDKDLVRPIAKKLAENKNFDIYFDEWSLIPGDSLLEKIAEFITKSGVFILFISENSLSSNWVRKEINIATISEIEEKGVKIIPARITECNPPSMLIDKLYVDFVKLGFDKGFEELLNAIYQKRKKINELFEPYKDIIIESEKVESDRKPKFAYRLDITIGTKRFQIEPIHFQLQFNQDISDYRLLWKGQPITTMLSLMTKISNNILEFKFQSPSITPTRHLLVIVYSDKPISLIQGLNMEG